ncbi:MAG: hypothetical protein WC788_04200 [Candidatus Paceibacterota bacterium]
MISSKIKNNIYALISLSIIMITIVSFVLITGFLVDMNDSVFNISDSGAGNNSVTLDINGYDRIKDTLATGNDN